MSLDITTLGKDGKPEFWVSIGLDVHERFLELAEFYNLQLIQRLSDYWSDVEFEVHELSAFETEIETLRDTNDKDQRVRDFLENLLSFVKFAKSKNEKLYAIAD